LTYIFAARCKDGVVLVADRKVMIGTSYQFEELFLGLHPVVWGSAGWLSFSESFNNRVNIKVRDFLQMRERDGLRPDIGIEDFRLLVEEAHEDMVRVYGRSYLGSHLAVLMAHRAKPKAELWEIIGTGALEPRDGYAGIGWHV
jgi:hypothetical protein